MPFGNSLNLSGTIYLLNRDLNASAQLTGAIGRILKHDVRKTLSLMLGTRKYQLNGNHYDCEKEKEEEEEEEEERGMRVPITCSNLLLFLTSPLGLGEPSCHCSHGQEGSSHPQSLGRSFSP